MPLSKERKEYLYDYQSKKLKRVPLDLTKEKYIEVQAAAAAAGQSVNGYIKTAIDQRIERDNSAHDGAECATSATISSGKEAPAVAEKATDGVIDGEA